MTFRVGQKVAYIGPDLSQNKWGQIVPKHGVVYTVRCLGVVCGVAALRLNEIRNAPFDWAQGRQELWMEQHFFRPVQERKRETDISVFLAMLNPSQVTVDAG